MKRSQFSLVVDPVRCDGTGVCAELLPERISVDPWGYPIIEPERSRTTSSIMLSGRSPAVPDWPGLGPKGHLSGWGSQQSIHRAFPTSAANQTES